jgi:Myosin head (motor domain)/RhoGEF domain/FYVE zinc finger/Myosin N-terminal SH3-like domain
MMTDQQSSSSVLPQLVNDCTSAADAIAKQHRLRQRVADEIVSTERTYVNSLHTIVNVYLRPIRASASNKSTNAAATETKAVVAPGNVTDSDTVSESGAAAAAAAATAAPAAQRSTSRHSLFSSFTKFFQRDSTTIASPGTAADLESSNSDVMSHLSPSIEAMHVYTSPILKSKYTSVLFSNVEQLQAIHDKFLDDLHERMKDWNTETCIADLFLEFAHYFKMYTVYVNSHPKGEQLLAKLLKDSRHRRFQEFVEQCKNDPRSRGLDIGSLLIGPIQRIPRYRLLLSELRKYTPEAHPDYTDLGNAVELVESVAKHVNEALRQHENRRFIIRIQESFTGSVTLVAPNRVFVRKGELIRVCRRQNKLYMFFLFNDILIYASKRGWKYSVNRMLSLDSSFSVEDEPDSAKLQNAWKVITAEKSFILFAQDEAEKKSWLKDFERCHQQLAHSYASRPIESVTAHAKLNSNVDDNAPIDGTATSAPVWVPDHEASTCILCETVFTFLNRRHHCRRCGNVVCSDCSKARHRLHTGSRKVRVCDKCSVEMQEARMLATRRASSSKTLHHDTQTLLRRRGRQNDVAYPSGSATLNRHAASALNLQKTTRSSVKNNRRMSVTDLFADMKEFVSTANNASADSAARTPSQSSLSSSTSDEFGDCSSSSKSETKSHPPGDSMTQTDDLQDVLDQWVWVPHRKHAYVPAQVYSEQGMEVTFRTADGEIISTDASRMGEMATASRTVVDGYVDDFTNLSGTEFAFAAVLHQLRQRYRDDKIYTLFGGILVSINPLRSLPLYDAATLDQYRSTNPDYLATLPPHVYGVAAAAFAQVKEHNQDSSIIISGESGAGKTETTKFIMQYLSDVAGSSSAYVQQGILQANPLLESFANAKTIRNDNSSRFGKWVQIQFANAVVCGAEIQSYLLETSRIVQQASEERNFHIFYQLCQAAVDATASDDGTPFNAGSSSGFGSIAGFNALRAQLDPIMDLLPALQLGPASRFSYLNKSGCFELPGVSERDNFVQTLTAMRATGFSQIQIDSVFRVTASILHIGNIVLFRDSSSDDDKAQVRNPEQVEIAAAVLGVSPHDLTVALTSRSVTIRGEKSTIPLPVAQAMDTRDALAKALYGKLFDWIIHRVNATLSSDERSADDDPWCQPPDIAEETPASTPQRSRSVFVSRAASSPSPAQPCSFSPLSHSHVVPHTPEHKVVSPAHTRQSSREVRSQSVVASNLAHLRLVTPPRMSSKKSLVKVNECDSNRRFIGVLDIFGFEIFARNSLEQFFINYTNEKLQQHFYHHFFKMEQAIYEAEGLNVAHISFTDNQDCLRLIETRVGLPGIFKLLDDEALIAKGTDKSFMRKVVDSFAVITHSTMRNSSAHPNFEHHMQSPNHFVIKHFAGPVRYDSSGFVQKNRDKVHESLCSLLRKSSVPLVNRMFPGDGTANDSGNGAGSGSQSSNSLKPAKPMSRVAMMLARERQSMEKKVTVKHIKRSVNTLAHRFQRQLQSLMSRVHATRAHFIRCIKPNDTKQPHSFDASLVLQQMKYGGLFEALNIRKLGYPFRKSTQDFVDHYKCVQRLLQHVLASVGCTSSDTKRRPSTTNSASSSANDIRRCGDLIQIIRQTQQRTRNDKEFGALVLDQFPEVVNQLQSLDLSNIQIGKSRAFCTAKANGALESLRQIAKQHEHQSAVRVIQAFMSQMLVKHQLSSESTTVSGTKSDHTSVNGQSSASLPHSPDDDATDTLQAAEIVATQSMRSKYSAFVSMKGMLRIERVVSLREKQLQFQTTTLKKSVVKLESADIGSRKAKMRMYKLAQTNFLNLLYFSGVKFHAYPATCGTAILIALKRSPLIYPEVILQLVKQTTSCPPNQSQAMLYCLRLLYLIVCVCPPESSDLLSLLLGYFSNLASSSSALPHFEHLTLDSPQDIASLCFFVLHKKPSEFEITNELVASVRAGSRLKEFLVEDELGAKTGTTSDTKSDTKSDSDTDDELVNGHCHNCIVPKAGILPPPLPPSAYSSSPPSGIASASATASSLKHNRVDSGSNHRRAGSFVAGRRRHRRSLSMRPCVVANCTAPRMTRQGYCSLHSGTLGTADLAPQASESGSRRTFERVSQALAGVFSAHA